MPKIRIALAQINPTVGNLNANMEKIIACSHRAVEYGADLVCFPELAITGYPPEDLLFKPAFIRSSLHHLRHLTKIMAQCPIALAVGFVDQGEGGIYNALAVISGGQIVGVHHKILLPNYGVFDEKRYFTPGSRIQVYRLLEAGIGFNICEDIWFETGPTGQQARMGAGLIINISASPYYMSRWKDRRQMLVQRAVDHKVTIAYANLIGGQDELVFDGHSMVIGSQGKLLACGKQFAEDLVVVDIDLPQVSPGTELIEIPAGKNWPKPAISAQFCDSLPLEAEVYQALVLGLRDYFGKNGFSRAVIGISGGIDSAITAVIAHDALGKDNVQLVFMPSRYSSEESRLLSEQLAKNLGVGFRIISIQSLFEDYLKILAPHFEGKPPGEAEENLQARIRGNLLMALSNKHGWLVLATGNKSEMSMGYATLYGDMVGGFALLKDVPKTLVYKLSRFRNATAGYDLIPQYIIDRPPTAELRENQKDTDSLPPYDVLDPIIEAYVEKDEDIAYIQQQVGDPDLVARVLKMIDRAEYKRRQSPLGIKITPKAFGKDRRMPVTNRFRS